ncbi:MAG: hypothetical protein WAO08_30835 [Hyphomicrobiaceae bacterium]
MTELVSLNGLTPWTSDVQRLIQRRQEGRSPHTVRAYGRDLAHVACWSDEVQGAIDALDKIPDESKQRPDARGSSEIRIAGKVSKTTRPITLGKKVVIGCNSSTGAT